MGRPVNWSKTQPLRADQVRQFELVAARLAELSDDALARMRMEWGDRVGRLCAEKGELDSELAAQMALSDVLVTELNYRLEVIYAAESELMGGHRVSIDQDGVTMGPWRAYCSPTLVGETCWKGPERAHIEDAIEDGRRHHPGYEPEVEPI